MPITKATGNSVTAAAKGDLVVGSATNDSGVLSVGANNTVLTADSSTATGLKWASTGITWTQRITQTTGQFNTIAYNGSNLYIAGGGNGVLYSSPDGITWTSRTSGFGANTIQKIAYGNGLWVAVGANGTLTTSTDGTTWTSRTSNMGANDIVDVVYDNSIWVAVGSGGGTTNTGGIIYSTDGITWTRKSQSLTVGNEYFSVIWNGTNWIVGATNFTNNTLSASTPSGTWTAASSGSGQGIYYIAWDGTRHYYQTNTATSAEWWYSTSTTMTSGVDLNLKAMPSPSTYKAYTYYNGSIYGIGIIIQSLAMATGLPTTNVLGFSPTCTIDSTGLSSNARTIWYGASGYIVSDNLGRLWTSF